MATGPKNGWGGRRPNQTGRPRTAQISDNEKKALVRAARAAAGLYGKTIEEELVRLCFEAKDARTQLAAIKLYLDATMVRESKSEVTQRIEAPIILPASRPDPSAEVVALRTVE